MKSIMTSAFGFVVAGWLAGGHAAADEQGTKAPSTPMQLVAQKMSGGGTVVSVDADTRHLTLKMQDGKELTVQVPESVKRLDEIKAGDHVAIDYYESIALSLKKGGEPGTSGKSVVARNPGKLPGGIVARQITSSVEIVKIEGDKVTIRKPDGKVDTVDVTDNATKADLAKLHEGDRIQATYTEAVAVDVTRGEPNKRRESTPSDEPKK